ncbi:MAG: class I SAM-dependent methyltransferase [Spirochaetales bacterium]|jgi:2-polyprenyl-3-methyl-5-hydroxy-6-metoxy-1,4-benzoquinol methylase|nr:class I SAM-dependent methyltransferase [Spirochaetales bacterium]
MKTFSTAPGNEITQRIICPVCGSDSFAPLWSFENYSFVQCISCSLVYQNPQPIQDVLTDRYDEEYFDYEQANEESFFELMSLGLNDIGFDEVSSKLHAGNRSFLDIGCATGRLIGELQQRDWQVQGVEVCAPAARHGIDLYHVPIHIGTLESADFQSTFSVIHCSHLIEHLTDPRAFVENVKRQLSPDGIFIITTPNISGFQAKLMGPKWRSVIADHMFLFSKRTLTRLLGDCGFDVECVKTWGGIGVGIVHNLVKKPLDIMAKRFGFGDVMIMRASLRTSAIHARNSHFDPSTSI